MKKKTYRSFEAARKFVHTLRLKNEKDDWRTYSKSGKRPDDIPTNPYGEYKKQGTWTSWPDFLGSYKTNPRSVPKKSEWSYAKAKKFLRKLGVTGKEDFYRLKKLGKIPKDIPSGAATIYKDKGWISWGDFLGTGNIGYGDRVYKSFTDAREFVQSLGFTRQDQWDEYIDSGNLPSDIPKTPRYVYKKEWKNMGDWLGTGRMANKDKEFWSYAKAKKFVIKIGIKSSNEFRKGGTDGRLPSDIPRQPASTYKNKGWKGWGDFVGTGVLRNQDKEFWSFVKAKAFLKKNKVTTRNDFTQRCKKGKIPKEIPRNANEYYKKHWNGWGDFLGTGYIANQSREYLSAKEARIEIARIAMDVFSGKFSEEEWIKAHREGKIPTNLPRYLDYYNPYSQRSQRRKKK